MTGLAACKSVSAFGVPGVVCLTFLAPSVIGPVLAGRQRSGVTVARLTLERVISVD